MSRSHEDRYRCYGSQRFVSSFHAMLVLYFQLSEHPIQVVTGVVSVALGTTVAGAVGGAVAGVVGGATGGAAGGAAGGSGAAQGGNMMGMISHIQFMNLCSAGDMGTPPETVAMSDGMGWANLQFESPFGWSDSNSTITNSTSITGNMMRRLLQANQNMNHTKSEPEISKVTYEEKKDKSRQLLHGNLMSGLGALVVEALIHLLIVVMLCWGTGMPHHAFPSKIQFPGSEVESFLALWNPLCLSSTMAFARHATSFLEDDEHWVTLTLSVLCGAIVEMPWLVWHSWFVYSSLYGEEGIRTLHFKETPMAKVLATRPTCKIFSLAKVKYQVCLFYEWFEWLLCLPFRLNFQGSWQDDPKSPSPGTVAVYGPLFMKFAPSLVHVASSVDPHVAILCLAVVILYGPM